LANVSTTLGTSEIV